MENNQPQQQDQRQDPILEALELATVADSSRIQGMKVVLKKQDDTTETTKAYYISSSAIKFRHEGEKNKSPPFLYLRDLSLTPKDGKVLVYYSSSGSGKTSELVGSSATRDSHLALVVTVEDPEEQDYEQFERAADYNLVLTKEMTSPSSQETGMGKGEAHGTRDFYIQRSINKLAADQAILPNLIDLVKSARSQLRWVLQAAQNSNRQLKLVLAIDEASSCPRVIRGILRFPGYIKDLVQEALERGLCDEKLKLSFDLKISIAGTGVSSSTIGSLPDNFCITTPYHETNFETVINYSLSEKPLTVSVPWSAEKERITSLKTIEDNLPVLATLMQNGRLASISFAKLRDHEKNGKEIKEGVLVDNIVNYFLDSNGMCQLVDNPKLKRVVAASALAVHLFSEEDEFKVRVPTSSSDVAEWANSMNFFSFSRSNDVSLRELVKRYGLLEPSSERVLKEHRGLEIKPPVTMSTPQQLIAVCMLGLDLASMLEPSWFGFELMSTHFVKCALAASAAVCWEKRPSVKDTLALLGFQLDEKATHKSVKETWKELENWNPVFTESDRERTYFSSTRQLDVGLKIVETEETENNPKGELLQIETKLMDSLIGATPTKRVGSIPPIACINEGNSELCDGIVTFWARHINETWKRKISIMIQAKDYHENSTLDSKKLNKHAERMSKTVLDGMFGVLRLLCVASAHDSLIARKPVSFEREYLPFVFNDGVLLSKLLSKLKSQRSQSKRTVESTCLCDEKGKPVKGVQVFRKRKSSAIE